MSQPCLLGYPIQPGDEVHRPPTCCEREMEPEQRGGQSAWQCDECLMWVDMVGDHVADIIHPAAWAAAA